MKNQISVKVKSDGGHKMILIDPDEIDYINPELGACAVHFVNGESVHVQEEHSAISKRIKELKLR